MLEKSVTDYLDVLATKEPVPGGGGAAALVAATGIALGTMVGDLTLGKKKYADVQERIGELMTVSEELRHELQRLSEADAEVFYPLSQAYGLPGRTDEEKAEKDAVLQPALLKAAGVPLDICRACVKALETLEEYSRIGTRIAISDVACGAAMVRAGLEAAQLNVLINTRLLKSEADRQTLEAEAAELVRQGVALADEVVARIRGDLQS